MTIQSEARASPPRAGVPRPLIGILSVIVTLAAASSAALYGEVGGVNGLEQLSASSATYLSRVAAVVPLGYAFGAGMVSAVNPCGFALLPAYLALHLRDQGQVSASRRLGRAAGFGLTVTAIFVGLFGLVGLAVAVVGSAIGSYFPWIGLAIGVIFVVAGGALIGGRHMYLGLAQRLADQRGMAARNPGLRGYAAFGLAFGASSLGCTLPIFLAVVGIGLVSNGPAGAVAQFILYALGMGSVLMLLAIGAAIVRHTTGARVRPLGRLVEPVGAVVLLLTGSYVVFYWLAPGGILAAVLALAGRG